MVVSITAGKRIPKRRKRRAATETRIRGFLMTSFRIFPGFGFCWLKTSKQITAKALNKGATTVEAMAMMLMSWPGYMEVARPIPRTTKLDRNTPWMTTPTWPGFFTSRGTRTIRTRKTAVTETRQKSRIRGFWRVERSAV